MALDIQERESQAEAEETAIAVEFEDESGAVQLQDDGVTPIACFVTGMLSTRYRRVQAIQRGRIIRSVSETAKTNGQLLDARDPSELSPDELEALDAKEGERSLEMQTEAVAACLTGWTPGFVAGGAPLEFTRRNAIRLLKAYPHYQRKVEKAMADHERFFAARSTT